MNITKALYELANHSPEKVALIEGMGASERQLSFRELSEVVRSTAHQLTGKGLGEGSKVLLMQPVGIDLYVVLLACFSQGITAIVIDPAVTRDVITYCCEQTLPDAFVGSAKAHLLRLKHSGFRKIKIQLHTSGYVPFSERLCLSQLDGDCPVVNLNPDHPALITLTSGSAGMPKIACRTHQFLIEQHHVLSSSLEHRTSDVDLVTLPIFGLANLASGMTSVIANTDLKYPAQVDSVAIVAQCKKYLVNRCAASPAFFKKLHADGNFPEFKTIFTGGAPVYPSFLKALSESEPDLEIVTVYGSTEAEPISHQKLSKLTAGQVKAQSEGKGLLVGKPVPEIQVMIEGEALGEILVTGEHVLKGYLNTEKNKETKVTLGGKIWHRTGDLGYLDEDENLWLMGRVNVSFLTKAGVTIYPFAIETMGMSIDGVQACAVIEFAGKATLCYTGSPALEKLKSITINSGIEVWLPLPKIPVDSRHNAKVNYLELHALLVEIYGT